MKLKPLAVLLVALAGAAGTFGWRAGRVSRELAIVQEPELRWLQREFAVPDDAMTRIAALHRRYTAECEPMCEALRTSDAEISRLLANGQHMTPELEMALKRSNSIVAECQRRMVDHFYAVAKEMPRATGERYLALMTPIAAHPEHGWMQLQPRSATAALNLTASVAPRE